MQIQVLCESVVMLLLWMWVQINGQ